MSEETKLPDGLDLAENLCSHAWRVGGCPTALLEFAVSAIRSEHAQRLTLQHHAADLAQRVADLEKERDSLRDAVIGTICRQDEPEPGHWLMPAWDFGLELRAERDELRARLAELERQEPAAWIEHDRSGTGQKRLHFDRRMACLRDEVINPVWTALFAGPVHAIPEGWNLVPVYLVATGLTHEDQELYTRHDEPVPMADNEHLYAAAPEHKA